MSKSSTIIVGGATGTIALMAIVVGFIWFCKSHCKCFSKRNSEAGSSDPSAQESDRGGSRSVAAPHLPGQQEPRKFTMEELEQATKNFNRSNLIGCGRFGYVYKGLLRDGTVVAIKKRANTAQDEFIVEGAYLSKIWHRNVVALLGYCQERGTQMLVFEYLPNGSICNHLYDYGNESTTKLEFKQRLSIALEVARGLCHLHSLEPPLLHKNFKTSNVLVDENFTAKVSNAGISKLLENTDEAGPSNANSIFTDPEADESGNISEMSDVYSYGVFLLELVTGREASYTDCIRSGGSLGQWVEKNLSSKNFVDHRFRRSFTSEGMTDFINLTLQCISFPGKGRPKMNMVVFKLEKIVEKEMALVTGTSPNSATVTLGSHLFT